MQPQNILEKIHEQFHWPGMVAGGRKLLPVPQCQKIFTQKQALVPLIPLPIIEVPFKWVDMDLVGHLLHVKTDGGPVSTAAGETSPDLHLPSP